MYVSKTNHFTLCLALFFFYRDCSLCQAIARVLNLLEKHELIERGRRCGWPGCS